MPDVIDNVKVGALIKQLLKERNMTQDSLANQLGISKSAVSQNLAGKSSFDLQNLIKISELFNVSLEALLTQKAGQDREVISEYERLTRTGLDALQKVAPQELNIKEPDLYGKVLIEYVMDYQKTDMFTYLFKAKIALYHTYHHHAQTILLKMIAFMLEKHLEGVDTAIYRYTSEYGAFIIEDDQQRQRIFSLLNKEKHQSTVVKLMRAQVIKERTVLSLFKHKTSLRVLTQEGWLTVIARYRLSRLFEVFLKTDPEPHIHARLVDILITHHYAEGLHLYIDALHPAKVEHHQDKQMNIQASLKQVVSLDDVSLLKKFIQKGYYEDLNELIVFLIERDKDTMIQFAIEHAPQVVNYRKVLKVAVRKARLDLLKRYVQACSPADKNYLLGSVAPDGYAMMIFLIKQGATFDVRNHGLDTYKRINGLLSFLLKKEGEQTDD